MNNGNRGSKILIFVRSLKNIFIITGQPGHCHEDASKNGDDEKEIPDILLGSKEEKKHWGFCDRNGKACTKRPSSNFTRVHCYISPEFCKLTQDH